MGQPSYGEVPLQIIRWAAGRSKPWTARDAAKALGCGIRAARRGVNTLADLGIVVDAGKRHGVGVGSPRQRSHAGSRLRHAGKLMPERPWVWSRSEGSHVQARSPRNLCQLVGVPRSQHGGESFGVWCRVEAQPT